MNVKKVLIVLSMLGLFSGSIAAEEAYHVIKVWPEAPQGWHFYRPRGVAVDQSGNVYIGDTGNYMVKRFDAEGRLITQWGSPGQGDGQFNRIQKIKVDSSGTVYVLDQYFDPTGTITSRIQKFTSYGQFVGTLERRTPDSDKIKLAVGMATDDEGNVFVLAVDYRLEQRLTYGVRIEKYSRDGELISQWETERGVGDGEFKHPAAIDVDRKGNIYIADSGNHRVQKFDPTGKFLIKWGTKGQGEGRFFEPRRIAIDKSGDVYILDRFNGLQKFTPAGEFLARWKMEMGQQALGIALDSNSNVYVTNRGLDSVLKLDNTGKVISQWGCTGTGDGRFSEPASIAADPSGHIVVVDVGKGLIERFTAQGQFVSKWGEEMDDPGILGLATDTSGNLYVACEGPDEVQKYDPDGKLIARWGSTGNGDGQFSYAPSIAVDPSGNLYMADFGNCRVQKFTNDGRFLAKWGTKGAGDGQFDKPFFIAVDGSGNVWVGDKRDNGTYRMQKFDANGRFLTKWTQRVFGAWPILTVDSSGNIYYAFESRIEKYDDKGNLIDSYGQEESTEGKLEKVSGMCIDKAGYLYISGPADPVERDGPDRRDEKASGSIRKYDPDGKLVSKWTAENTGRKENLPNDQITVDGAGNVYVSCVVTVWKLSSDGKFVAEFQIEPPLRGGSFVEIGGVAIDSSGKVYAVNSNDVDSDDGNPPSIQKFQPDGEFITMWEVPKVAGDKFKYPAQIAVDGSGNAYVTDQSSHCVHKLDTEGKYIKSWGTKGTGDGQFDTPEGIAVDRSGNVYVCDRQNCRIQKFDSNGRFLAKWGKEGSGDGEFHFPAAVALDKEGNVFVADSDNNRIQKFTADGKFLTKWGEFGEAPGQLNVPLGIAVDAAGNVYVSDSHNHRIQKFAPVPSR